MAADPTTGAKLTATAADLQDAVAAALADPPAGRSRTVDASGYAWHVVEWGRPEHPPVLLLHGVTSNLDTFWRVGPSVAAAGRRVIAVDLPGHSRTGGWRGRHRFVETAADVASLLRAAQLDASGIAVLGHSWGGMTAASLPMAGFRPERLILLDPPALSRDAIRELTQDATERRYEDVDEAIEAIRASGVSWSEGDVRAKAIALTQMDEHAVRAIYLENDYDAGISALTHPAADGIPTWIIRGDPAQGGLIADAHVPALADRVGANHIATVAGAGHSPQRTHPEATILAILQAIGLAG